MQKRHRGVIITSAAVGKFLAYALLWPLGGELPAHQIDLRLEQPDLLPSVSVAAEVQAPPLAPVTIPQVARRILLEVTPMESGGSSEISWATGEEVTRVRIPVALVNVPPVVALATDTGPQVVDAVVMPSSRADTSLSVQTTVGAHIVACQSGKELTSEDRALVAALMLEAQAQATAWNARAAELLAIEEQNEASRAAFRETPRIVTIYLWNHAATQP